MDWRPLHRACWEGDAREVKKRLLAGADPNRQAPTAWRQRPLHRTLEFRVTHPKHSGHVEVVRLLLEAGANPQLRATTLDMTPWELACLCGLGDAERLLRKLQRGSPPHPGGMSLLWLESASRLPESGALRRVGRLLAEGADPDHAFRGATPLMMAAAHAAHPRVAERLPEHGANPDAGTSLLHASCKWHFESLIPALKFFASNGLDIQQADEEGRTAPHMAAYLGYVGAVRALLALGANPLARRNDGATPEEVARKSKKSAALHVLHRVI